MYIKRAIEKKVKYMSDHFPVVMVCGARQTLRIFTRMQTGRGFVPLPVINCFDIGYYYLHKS